MLGGLRLRTVGARDEYRLIIAFLVHVQGKPQLTFGISAAGVSRIKAEVQAALIGGWFWCRSNQPPWIPEALRFLFPK